MTTPDPSPDRWTVPIQGGQGTVAGHHNTQHNSFQAAVSGLAPQDVPPPRGMHNLPPASTVFVGRDLGHLDSLLDRSEAGVVVGQVAVHGLGGIGKTELVIHYCHAVRRRYPLMWWITADNPDNISQGLAWLSSRLQSTVAVAHAREWAIDWLQTHPGWLLILDNVENISDIQPLLGQVARYGDVLVTTRRDPAAGGWAPLGLTSLQLEPLGRAASIELLVRLTGNDDLDGAAALAHELGDLPLALEQAAAYISRHHGMDYHSYRNALTTRFDTLSRYGGRGGRSERTIGQVWEITMTTIADESPLARVVLDVIAWLAPEQLPQDVLYPLADKPDDVLDAIAILSDHNMIKWQSRKVSVHRLVQAVTRAAQAGPGHEKRGIANQAVQLLGAATPAGHPGVDVNGWSRWSSLLVHIDALYAAMPRDRVSRGLLRLADSAATYRQGQGQLSAAILQFERVLADCRRVLGDEDPNTLITGNNLAVAYQEAARMAEATDLLKQVLSAQRRILGNDHPNSLRTRHNLAYAYREAGRVDDAIDLFEQVLSDQRRVLGDDHPDTLDTRHNLAFAFRKGGRLARAIALFERAFADQQRIHGDDHPHTMSTRRNLGVAYKDAGRLDEAIALLEQVLSDQRRVLGDDHPDTLDTRHSLALSLRRAGRVNDAITMLEQVLADYQRVLGDDHPSTLVTRHRLAHASHTAGLVAEALLLYERVLADCRRLLGDDHQDTLQTCYNLAQTHRSAGHIQEAITLLAQVFTDQHRVLGEHHPDTQRTAEKLRVAIADSRSAPARTDAG